MKEKFEHKITNRINEVFDSHQVDYNPQDWEKLKSQLPKKKSKFAALLWTTTKVAAVIILVLAGVYLFWGRNQINETVSEKNLVQNTEENIHINNNGVFTDTTLKLISDKPEDLEKNTPDPKGLESDKVIIEEKNLDNNSNLLSKQIVNIPQKSNKQKETSDYTLLSEPLDTIVSENEITELIAIAAMVQDDNIYPDTARQLQEQSQETPDVILQTKPKKAKVRLGVELATFTNYSPENINPEMNYGAGITADIPIRKRFSFNPGLVISAYNMELEDRQILDNGTGANTLTSFEVNEIINNDPNIKPSEVQLTGFDIPINFQYQFLQRKKGNYFVELGFSSLIYISENYSYDLSYIDNSGCPPGQTCSHQVTVSEELSTPAFKTFDFAKFLNFSMGMDYHLSKRFDMVVNPYLKYPISSLSGAEIKFGSGGGKLKFMIVPKK